MNLSRVSERYGLKLKTGLKSAHCYNQNASKGWMMYCQNVDLSVFNNSNNKNGGDVASKAVPKILMIRWNPSVSLLNV